MPLLDQPQPPAPQSRPLDVSLTDVEDHDWLIRVDLVDVPGVISRMFDVLRTSPALRRQAELLLSTGASTAEAKRTRELAIALIAGDCLVRGTFGCDLTPEQRDHLVGELKDANPDDCAAGCGALAVIDGLCTGHAFAEGLVA